MPGEVQSLRWCHLRQADDIIGLKRIRRIFFDQAVVDQRAIRALVRQQHRISALDLCAQNTL